MKTLKRFPLFLLLCLLWGTQLSAQNYKKYTRDARRSYEAGKYDEATKFASDALIIRQDYDKAIELLTLAYPSAKSQHENAARIARMQTASFAGESTVTAYRTLIKEYESLQTLLSYVRRLPPIHGKKRAKAPSFDLTTDYSNDLMAARQGLDVAIRETAEMFYQEGLKLMEAGGLDNNKAAAYAFKNSQRYVSGYKDASEKYQVARKAATKKVAILPFENRSGKYQYGAVAEKLSDQLVASLFRDRSSMEFVELINRDQLDVLMRERQMGEMDALEAARSLGVHEIITGKVTQITSSQSPTTHSRVRNTKNVVVAKQSYINENGKKRYKNIYGDVEVLVNQYEKSGRASVQASYQIIEVSTGKVKNSSSLSGSYDVSMQWGTFQGDKRALSSAALKLTSKTEQPLPTDEVRVDKATDKLISSLSREIKGYIR